jgi:hypothetical protein
MNRLATIFIAAVCTFFVNSAVAALYTTNFGSVVPDVSDCDDCASGLIAFGGGQTINYFGNVYSGLYISSNGYVTFDGPHTNFSTDPVDMRTDIAAVVGFITDLSTQDDPLSNIFVNTDVNGQIIVTFDQVYHSGDTDSRSTFQLVIRSDQFNIPAGEGQIGFFYGDINDDNLVSAGIGDGKAEINPGEVSFATQVPGSSLSNNDPRFYTLNNVGGGGGGEQPPGTVPEPAGIVLVGGALAAAWAARRRQRQH